MLCDVIEVILSAEDFQFFASAAFQADIAIVKLQAFAGGDQAEITSGEDSEFINRFAVGFHPILDDLDAKFGGFDLVIQTR